MVFQLQNIQLEPAWVLAGDHRYWRHQWGRSGDEDIYARQKYRWQRGQRLSGTRQQKFEFDITQTGDYVIVFYADAVKNADFVVGLVSLQAKEFHTTAIRDVVKSENLRDSNCYDLMGRRIVPEQLKRGIYVNDGRKFVIR